MFCLFKILFSDYAIVLGKYAMMYPLKGEDCDTTVIFHYIGNRGLSVSNAYHGYLYGTISS